MRNISFQDLLVKPLRGDSPAVRREATCVYFGSSFSRAPKPSAPRSARTVESDPASRVKGSIGFILGEAAASASTSTTTPTTTTTTCITPTLDYDSTGKDGGALTVDDQAASGFERLRSKCSALTTASDGETSPVPKRKKRKARICKEPGCDKYVVDHGLCIRHGVSGLAINIACSGGLDRSQCA